MEITDEKCLIKAAIDKVRQLADSLASASLKINRSRGFLSQVARGIFKPKLSDALQLELHYNIDAWHFVPKFKEILINYNKHKNQQFALEQQSSGIQVTEIRLSQIKYPYKSVVTQDKINNMQQLLAHHGQERWIAVTPKQELIYGYTRCLAAKALGWETIKVIYLDPFAIWHANRINGILAEYLNQAERFKVANFMVKRFCKEPLPCYEPFSDYCEASHYFTNDFSKVLRRLMAQQGPEKRRLSYISKICSLISKERYRSLEFVFSKGIEPLKRLVELELIKLTDAYKIACLPKKDQVTRLQTFYQQYFS